MIENNPNSRWPGRSTAASTWMPAYFTGSYPPGWKGWHFSRRQTVRPSPRTTPSRRMTSTA